MRTLLQRIRLGRFVLAGVFILGYRFVGHADFRGGKANGAYDHEGIHCASNQVGG